MHDPAQQFISEAADLIATEAQQHDCDEQSMAVGMKLALLAFKAMVNALNQKSPCEALDKLSLALDKFPIIGED